LRFRLGSRHEEDASEGGRVRVKRSVEPRRARTTLRETLSACAAALLIASALTGCTLIDQMIPSKRDARARAEQLQSLQLSVMRFADEYVGRTGTALSQFQSSSTSAEERLAAQNWKVQQATAAYTDASGPNPVNNALDLVVLASLSSIVANESWVEETYGARAKPVQETYHALESDAWQLLTGVLNDAQITQLRELIDRWRAQHPNVRDVAYVNFRDFASSVGAPLAGGGGQPGGLFSMLGIDPFSGLDPAVRELAQSRALAERAIYYMQRIPALLDMQVERLTFQLAVMPETKALLSDAERASLVGSASEQLVRTLPDVIRQEREALVSQLGRTLNDESATIGSLAGELRPTLQAGTETANALRDALQAFERVRAQFAPKPGTAPAEKGPPFDIRQYTEMLREATNTTRELNALAQRADSLSPLLRTATQQAAGRVDQILNHLFFLLLVLILAAITGTLLAVIAYRRIVIHLQRGDLSRSVG
jgi:hypothetical protein